MTRLLAIICLCAICIVSFGIIVSALLTGDSSPGFDMDEFVWSRDDVAGLPGITSAALIARAISQIQRGVQSFLSFFNFWSG